MEVGKGRDFRTIKANKHERAEGQDASSIISSGIQS
jgi:hypothetical protein